MIMTHADINFYSPSDNAVFELDMDEGSEDPNCSLFIRHVHKGGEMVDTVSGRQFIEGGSMVSGRHFLTLEQLKTLRDLLNEKLPPSQFAEFENHKEEAKHASIERDLNT